jgi:uroporphyrinogen decarboxylase
MEKRKIVYQVIKGLKTPYVPWHCSFTQKAEEKLKNYWGEKYYEEKIQNHFLEITTREISFNFKNLGNSCFEDYFGVVFDRSVDKDIGAPKGITLKEPRLGNYQFPNPSNNIFFNKIPEIIKEYPDRFRIFYLDFSLYERAWLLRGMENLLMDMILHPNFVHNLLGNIVDFNIEHIKQSLKYDIDAVCFGDDWGAQRGLQMGPMLWKEFIYPELKRMYKVVKKEGRFVYIHCCGKVEELFDDLIDIGVDIFNPFQPEVMDIYNLLKKYKGKLTFHGGMSTQRVLPYYTSKDVIKETLKLINAGRESNYIFSPAHAVPMDVPLENMVAFIEELKSQKGFS